MYIVSLPLPVYNYADRIDLSFPIFEESICIVSLSTIIQRRWMEFNLWCCSKNHI